MSWHNDKPHVLDGLNPIDLPPNLLRAAYLVGKIPLRALRSDPRVSYAIYIPEQYLAVHEALRNSTSDLPKRLPLVVNIHSTRRDAITCRDSLIDFADQHGVAILAPLFPAALDTVFDLDSYKDLRTNTLQSDLRLLDMLNEITHIWSGIETDPVTLIGFSGGAQFVNRFMYLYPERLSAVAIAAPGKVTKLTSEAWPKGIGNAGEVFPDCEIDIAAVTGISDVLLLAGEKDEFSDETVELLRWLKQRKAKLAGESIEEQLSRASRVQSLQSLHRDLQHRGIKAEMEIVPGVGHTYRDLLPSLLSWLKRSQTASPS